MKKIIYLACMLVFFVVGYAGAVPQNITLGPCNVTFDLGFDESVSGVYTEVVRHETYRGDMYDIYKFVSLDDAAMMVTVSVFVSPDERWPSLSTEEWEDVLFPTPSDRSSGRVYPREFDGNMGNILVIKDPSLHVARYNALNDTVEVCVLSAYPWNEGTTNLLNSIHLEKAT